MRKTLLVTIALLMSFMVAGVAFAAPGDGIAGSNHDFTTLGWQVSPYGTANLGLCEACHAPHGTQGKDLLWNRELPDAGTYANDLNTVFDTTWGTPDGTTLLCLSCHDGTIAMDNYGGLTGGTEFVPTWAQIGPGTLDGNHPVSIDYTAALIGTELNTEASVRATNVRLYGPEGSGRVQCGSCHDVHNKATVFPDSLRADEDALCLACHDK